MRVLSQIKTEEQRSASNFLELDRLTAKQQEVFSKAVGKGLWNAVSDAKPMRDSTMKLIKMKLEANDLLPGRMWWDENE